MTHGRWMAIWQNSWEKAVRDHPTADRGKLHGNLYRAMVETYGECPPRPDEPKPPWWGRLLLRVVRGKLKKRLEAKMDGKASKIPKWALALIAGAVALPAVLDLALADGTINAQEWIAIGNAFVVAAWAKFSNPEKKLSPKPSLK
jgi:hypothetical protein